MNTVSEPNIGASKLPRYVLLAVLAAGIAWGVMHRGEFNGTALTAWVQDAGAWGPLAFMGVYAIATVLFLPGSVLTLAGGALFGPYWGTFYNLTGATLGATLAFLVARYLASDWAARKAGGRLKQLIEGVEGEGWRFVAFVRLVPVFPFNVLNYALGLTRLKFVHYLVATYFCMIPGAIAYTYLGYAGREAAAGGTGLIQKGLLALGLLALAVFLPSLIKRLRKRSILTTAALKQRLDSGDDILVLDVRDAIDYDGGRISGAQNVPLPVLANQLEKLEAWRDRSVAVVCRTDKRSAKAVAMLNKAGFSQVHLVVGGMTQWTSTGLPVENNAP